MSKIKKEIWIVTGSLVTPTNPEQRRIGGIETATVITAEALEKLGLPIKILQASPQPFETQLTSDIPIIGLKKRVLLRKLHSNHNALVFLTDHSFLDMDVPPIDMFHQHGVYWDGFYRRFQNTHLHRLHILRQRYLRYRAFRRMRRIVHQSKLIVTVDTNFQNWYRGLWPWDAVDKKCVYIPNSAPLWPFDEAMQKWNDCDKGRLRIVFARRFVRGRGTLLWAHIAASLLQKRENVEILMAGSGPDQKEMESICPPGQRVRYEEFTHENLLLRELPLCHVSVVPTLFCEGTSRSLLESMGAGCACVATPIGGICDIIQNNSNALLAPPEEQAFQVAVETLLDNREFARTLAKNGWETVRDRHTDEQWKKNICEVVRRFLI